MNVTESHAAVFPLSTYCCTSLLPPLTLPTSSTGLTLAKFITLSLKHSCQHNGQTSGA